jgi:hypothetical protein
VFDVVSSRRIDIDRTSSFQDAELALLKEPMSGSAVCCFMPKKKIAKAKPKSSKIKGEQPTKRKADQQRGPAVKKLKGKVDTTPTAVERDVNVKVPSRIHPSRQYDEHKPSAIDH